MEQVAVKSRQVHVSKQYGYIPRTLLRGKKAGKSIRFKAFHHICRASLVAQEVKNLLEMQETWVRYLAWEDSLEKKMATHSNIRAWENPMDRRAWLATVHGVAMCWTRLSK